MPWWPHPWPGQGPRPSTRRSRLGTEFGSRPYPLGPGLVLPLSMKERHISQESQGGEEGGRGAWLGLAL